MSIIGINDLNKRGGELFDKRFSQRLDKNEALSTITEEAIKEAKQLKPMKMFAENQSVETLF